MEQREPQAPGVIQSRVERGERRLERKRSRDAAHRVVSDVAQGPARDQGERGDRQREQEAQQRGGPHVPGQRSDGHAERGEPGGPEHERRQPEGRAGE